MKEIKGLVIFGMVNTVNIAIMIAIVMSLKDATHANRDIRFIHKILLKAPIVNLAHLLELILAVLKLTIKE